MTASARTTSVSQEQLIFFFLTKGGFMMIFIYLFKWPHTQQVEVTDLSCSQGGIEPVLAAFPALSHHKPT